MYEFHYKRAASVEDAARAMTADPDAKLLAGGQSLVASMKLRLSKPSVLVDLGRLDALRAISVESAAVVIGAMATHAQVAASLEVKQAIPALALLAADIGDRQVRNMGTIGGSIALSDPAADYPAACLGLGATIRTHTRSIAADDFFLGMYETALQANEIITAVSFPVPKRAAYMKFRNQASRFALVGVFVAETAQGPRVAVTGAGPCAFRVTEMEHALAKNFTPEAVARVQVAADPLNTDLHADASYRAHLITVMAQRAVGEALR